jgi:formate dehydrogenase subunit gamma
VHWANAALFSVLLATGATLYAGPLSTIVGHRVVVKTVHVWAGVGLPVPLLAGLAGPWRRGLRRDLTRLNRWDDDDRRWLRSRGRDATVRLGKFNPGQKLNAAFVAGAIVVMLGTGSIMRWFSPFPVGWRTGATFVHDWGALAVLAVVVGHVTLAVGDPDSLRSMLRGWVPAGWARRNRPKWYEEAVSAPPSAAASLDRS